MATRKIRNSKLVAKKSIRRAIKHAKAAAAAARQALSQARSQSQSQSGGKKKSYKKRNHSRYIHGGSADFIKAQEERLNARDVITPKPYRDLIQPKVSSMRESFGLLK